jgi:hypothetical protein
MGYCSPGELCGYSWSGFRDSPTAKSFQVSFWQDTWSCGLQDCRAAQHAIMFSRGHLTAMLL